MKSAGIFFVCIYSVLMGGQAVAPPNTEALISRVLQKGAYDGWTSKQLGATGDAAAVALTKVIAGGHLSARDITSALIVVDLSFASPKGIENESDRSPRTALFVLQYLDQQSRDPNQKKRIVDTQNRLQQYLRSQ
jgi:hypothetical protein